MNEVSRIDVPRIRDDQVTIRIARGMDDFQKVMAIRAAVFWEAQDCPYEEEFDGNDWGATHILTEVDGEPAACIRIRWFAGFAKSERACVRPKFRRSRILHLNTQWIFKHVARKGYEVLVTQAEERLIKVWKRHGFEVSENKQKLTYLDRDCVELVARLPKLNDRISLASDPAVMNRLEGHWDEPGILEKSAERGSGGAFV